MRTNALTICLVLLMTLLPLTMLSGVAQPGLPALGVEIEPIDEVESDPVEFTHVKATATVTLENPPLLGTTVNVNATAETWLVTVEPTSFDVAQGTTGVREETINLDIRVPPKASAERPVELRVFANFTTTTGFPYEASDSFNITVFQFYGLRLNTNSTMSLDQGKNLTARMRITNTGNGVDNFTISLNNGATLGTKGITVEHDESVHEVGRERTVSVVIEVMAADDADLGETDAIFTVRSEGDSTKTASWQVSITVKEGDTNGGNGNGGNGDGDEDGGLSRNTLIGIVLVIIVLIGLAIFLSRSAGEAEAEDEDYVVGRDRDAEDR
ncbi:MAG: hypothetical protein GWN18_19240 [Thermoplasmata archaeon]|nr:hypothetical protein [Thermoplasmata archaeon]NIS14281.1 hypothetical protein [Thermoplasmata archaeon]NIS22107.1 hypothetical protein [Thermoplasmata archaeon]NIT79987.1 hypothetical protein [Thermoplasmata archaeon]NIU51123.1 hypothetical protein [Thermoplasmata archaeon]